MALCKSHTMANARGSFRIAKNNRSKSVCTLFQRKRLNNQTVWPVIFGLTGPICARALKSLHLLELRPRGHHDWPVKPTIRKPTLIFLDDLLLTEGARSSLTR